MDIFTARLHIRDVIETDAASLHLLRTDPAVYRFNHFGPETLAQTRHWLERTQFHNARPGRDSHNCAIILRDSVLRDGGEVIGWIGFGFSHPDQKPIGDVGIGYAIRPQFWGQGYTTEALRATLDFIFRETPAAHANAYCDVQNVASARVMEKAGMQRVAREAHPDPHAPENAEIYRYRLSREQWQRDHGKEIVVKRWCREI